MKAVPHDLGATLPVPLVARCRSRLDHAKHPGGPVRQRQTPAQSRSVIEGHVSGQEGHIERPHSPRTYVQLTQTSNCWATARAAAEPGDFSVETDRVRCVAESSVERCDGCGESVLGERCPESSGERGADSVLAVSGGDATGVKMGVDIGAAGSLRSPDAVPWRRVLHVVCSLLLGDWRLQLQSPSLSTRLSSDALTGRGEFGGRGPPQTRVAICSVWYAWWCAWCLAAEIH